MKNIGLIFGTLLLVTAAAAQPRIVPGGVKNAASYAAQGLPNAPIAQGSIFSVFGDNLGPDTAEFGFNYPLPTVTPAGKVSLSVTVNGTTTQGIILYSGKTQINAVLPSSTPVGLGTLTVNVNGQTGVPVPIEVVASDFGTFAVNGAGTGAGIVTYADFSLVTVDKAANPGETLILWGTGLGPVAGNEAGGALPGDQVGVPLEIYVGGKQASSTYRGRSGCCAGLDQIGLIVPAGVEGCAVPVAVKIGDRVSNFTTMPVAASGRACLDEATGLTGADLKTPAGKTTISLGSIGLTRTTAAGGTTESGFAGFERFNLAPGTGLSPSLFNSVSMGSCTVTGFAGASANPLAGFDFSGLDAGAGITISGPSGTRTLTPSAAAGAGVYLNANLGNGTPGNFLDPGPYTITGAGGTAVAPFSANVAAPMPLVWTNQSAITTVNQSAGQLITWSGGDPGGYVSIDGANLFNFPNAPAAGASFHCQARVSDGSFTIPPTALLSLPPTVGTAVGTLSVTAFASKTFQASGLDVGVVTLSSGASKTVTYQGAIPPQNIPPVANAGPNQVVTVGATVQLNASGSMDPAGNPLTYQFRLFSVPPGSTAVLSNPTAVNPTFVADRPGTYVAQLIVSNGKLSSDPVIVSVTTSAPAAPTANAGPAQTATVNAVVALSGSGTDPQSLPLTFKWTLTSKPAGSNAVLSNPAIANPTFVADRPGSYVAQLIVNNSFVDSAPSTVTVTVTSPGQPVANAGPDQSNVAVGSTVALDGSGSSSPNKTPLTYAFSFVSRPPGSAAALTGANTVSPRFMADVAGTYVVQLIVNDGVQNSAPATVTITTAGAGAPGPPASIAVSGGSLQNASVSAAFALPLAAIVKDANGRPVSGVTVTFTAPASGPSGSFAGGLNTAVTNASGVATSAVFTANATAGAYTVLASVSGVSTPASFALNNAPIGSSGGIAVGSASVGQNLQTQVTITLPQPAGTGGVPLTVTSGDPTKLLVATRATDTGQGALSAPVVVAAGATSATVFVQGLGSSGTVSLTASAPNLGSGTGTITLTPSGFVLTGPNGAGVPNFTTSVRANTPITVTSARLDSSLKFAEAQSLRGGMPATVSITSSTASVGTVAPPTVTFTGGQDSTATTQFTAATSGSTTLTAAVPTGFSTPAGGANMLTANVGMAGVTAGSDAVGQNLQTAANVTLSGPAPAGGAGVTLASGDASKLLLSTTPTAAGSGSITVTVPSGASRTPDFYLQGLSNSGTVSYTATAPGFGTGNGTVTLTSSGIIIAGPLGLGAANFFTGTRSTPSQITVYAVQVDPASGNFAIQMIRGGLSASVNVTSSNAAVGTIAPSPVTIAGGSSSAVTSFQPLSAGSSTLAVNAPTGFTPLTQLTTVTANVRVAGIALPDQIAVGMNLQIGGTLVLGQPAAGPVTVALASNDPKLLLSTSANTAGSSSISVTVPSGASTATFYIQALAASGTATYTATAPGYQTSTGTITYGRSGVVLSGPFGIGFPFTIPTKTTSGPTPLTVNTALLDAAGNFVATQQLAPGFTLAAALTSSAPTVGTVPAQATITGGSDSVAVQFTPVAVGTTTISLAPPAGYTPASSTYGTVKINVQ